MSLKGSLRFKSWAGQIGHSVDNVSPPLQYFLKRAVLPGRNDAEMGPANSLHGQAKQRWKPVGSTGIGRVERPVGLPVGSRFFDRSVKPVEKQVKFSFLATKRHLSTNRNILIYFIINKTFCKKSVLTNHTFWKHLLNGFKLWLICCDH